MGISLDAYRYRIGCFASVVGHRHAVEPVANSTSRICHQKTSGKVSCFLRFWRSVFDDFRSHKAVACWFLILATTILTLRSGDVDPHPGPVTGRESKSQDATPSASLLQPVR